MEKIELAIESLPLPDRVKIAEEFKSKYEYSPNEYADARDTTHNWLVAYITKKEATSAAIMYDGWASKWDEV
jgi:hypothetical protein